MLEYNRVKLGIYLKLARIEARLTRTEVSLVLGYTCSQFVSNIERGVSVIPLRMLAKMLRLYGISGEPIVQLILQSQREILRTRFGLRGRSSNVNENKYPRRNLPRSQVKI